jgi:type I restriction enzyme S subunit
MMRRYPAYRDSGVEWLGEVPEGWEVVRLKHACRVFPSNVDKHPIEGELPVSLCNYTDVYYREEITADIDFMQATARIDEIEKFSLLVGDVIFTKDSETADDIGIAALVKEELPGVVCGYHLSIARPRSGVSGGFVKRFFDSRFAKACFEVRANGLTRVGLGQAAIDNLPFPLPPFPEQTIIAAFLDRETAKIDALVAEQRRLIDLLKEKRQAVISHAVTRGLNPAAPMKPSGVDGLGDVPEGWEVCRIGRHAEILSGFAFPSERFSQDESETRLLRGVNVGVGEIRWDETVYWARTSEDGLDRWELQVGDLVIGMDRPWISSGTRAALIESDHLPCLLLQRVAAIRTNARLDRRYLIHHLRSDRFRETLLPDTTGVSVPHISPKQIADFVVPVPPLLEQAEIVATIERDEQALDQLLTTAETAIALLQERRAALISAAVTGKIDVRDLARSETEAA